MTWYSLSSLIIFINCVFFFFEKNTSLTIINININKETKLNVHEGYTKSNRGREDQHLIVTYRIYLLVYYISEI